MSRIVWLASAQHAAVNFPQLPIMSWSLGYPLANFAPAATPDADEAFLYAQAAPLDVAQEQLEPGYLLGSLHDTRLGEYPRRWFGLEGWFQDRAVGPLLEDFQADLAAVEAEILRRPPGVLDSAVLRPSLIPRSINI